MSEPERDAEFRAWLAERVKSPHTAYELVRDAWRAGVASAPEGCEFCDCEACSARVPA